jgi:hypothetical protein
VIEKTAQEIGLFSLARDPLNPLMWAHYADSHQGFCIGINEPVLLTDITGQDCFPAVVAYGEYPELDSFDNSKEGKERYGEALWVKDGCWSYEQEHRLIRYGKPRSIIRLTDQAIDAIYLGIYISAEHKDEIIDIAKRRSPRPKLYQVKRKRRSFDLECEELSY